MQGHLIAVVSGYTFKAFKRDGTRFVEGSSRSRADGSGTSRRRSRAVAEVDVHGRRGSSGTRSIFGEVLDESDIIGATVVVHGRRGTCWPGLGEDVLGESA